MMNSALQQKEWACSNLGPQTATLLLGCAADTHGVPRNTEASGPIRSANSDEASLWGSSHPDLMGSPLRSGIQPSESPAHSQGHVSKRYVCQWHKGRCKVLSGCACIKLARQPGLLAEQGPVYGRQMELAMKFSISLIRLGFQAFNS